MDCNQKPCRSCVGLVLSALAAIIIGVLFFFGFIPNFIVAVWVAGALGVLGLIFLFVLSVLPTGERSTRRSCLCRCGTTLLVGSIGTIVTALAAVSVALGIGLVLSAILFAVGAFFFALLVYALVALFLCVICSRCG